MTIAQYFGQRGLFLNRPAVQCWTLILVDCILLLFVYPCIGSSWVASYSLSFAFVSLDGPKLYTSNQRNCWYHNKPSRKIQHQLFWQHTATSEKSDQDEEVISQSGRYYTIDPVLLNLMERNVITISGVQAKENNRNTILTTSQGLDTWRKCLLKGRVPIDTDFHRDEAWPSDPNVYESLVKAITLVELPQLVSKHPEIVNSVLITMIQLINSLDQQKKTILDSNTLLNEETEMFHDGMLMSGTEDDDVEGFVDICQNVEDIIVNGFIRQWGNVVQGVKALDSLFGTDHGLLDVENVQNNLVLGQGFGLDDGVWSHTGWEVIPKLQKQLSTMPELRAFMKSIGRRSTTEDSNSIHKFKIQKAATNGAQSAISDVSMRMSVSGLTLSGSLTDMLPSEAVLLRTGSFPVLRRLFFAKKLESKLFSYQMSGWTDLPSVPFQQKYKISTPSGSGGPLILCLDTSWSMSGVRETLSKAVTLACVSAAHKQKRDCQIVAFSNALGVMETGTLSPDAEGIRLLLDFLSHSFVGGGTDVTGALKHAMDMVESGSMTAADILLVTDGEIQDPPVSPTTMTALHNLQQSTGMQVYGLLVGKRESKALSKICSQVYDFLSGYETKLLQKPTRGVKELDSRQQGQNSIMSMSAVRCQGLFHTRMQRQNFNIRTNFFESTRSRYMVYFLQRRKMTKELFALKSKAIYTDDKRQSKNQQPQLFRKFFHFHHINRFRSVGTYVVSAKNDVNSFQSDAATFNEQIESIVSQLQADAESLLDSRIWLPEALELEKTSSSSCWKYCNELKTAINNVRNGLVERDDEAKLVVLGMISQEHVLLLGPPGTGKSALGRRLSSLCGGFFFQRLLTKFTTPDEIFGPLSLRALENDEYRRCTEGYLPSASVAFLDEIFKANSAILNTLLTILNERKYDNGQGNRQSCPIQCVVGASNELPESEDLDALYDRFLLRKEVKPVSDDGLIRLLSSTGSPQEEKYENMDVGGKISVPFSEGLDIVINRINIAADSVVIDLDVCSLIRDLRSFMREEFDVIISDRRLVKAARLLKICAATNGRNSVDTVDCLLLEHIAWQNPNQRQAVRDWLWDHLTPGGESALVATEPFRLLLSGLTTEAIDAIRKSAGDIDGSYGARDSDISLIKMINKEIAGICQVLEERLAKLTRHAEILRQSTEHIWLTPDEAQTIIQQLLPRATMIAKSIRETLIGALCLQRCLTDTSIDPSLRLSVIELLGDEGNSREYTFTDDELSIGMKEAKGKYDGDMFRAWKRARKKRRIE